MNPERLAFGKKKRNKSRLPKTRYLSTTRQDMKKNGLDPIIAASIGADGVAGKVNKQKI